MAPVKHSRKGSVHPPSTSTLILDKHRTVHPFFTPTHLSFTDASTGDKVGSWSSRRARKGRYTLKSSKIHYVGPSHLATTAEQGRASAQAGRVREKGKQVAKEAEGEMTKMQQVAYGRLKGAETHFKPHLKADISFWLAVSFTLGSAVWVVNGYLVWFPVIRPELDTTAFSTSAAATAFVGGSIFEIGSYLMVVEALDRGRETNFGTALGRILHHRRHVRPSASALSELKADVKHPSSSRTSLRDGHGDDRGDDREEAWPEGSKGFVWWGKPLWHDLGYLAAFIQLVAATVFWVSTLTGLPGVIPGFSDGGGSTAIIDVFFWTPQVVGGTGFIISALILMVEVQKKWWLPNLTEIGWWVGFWNLIGAIGFALCGALGYPTSSGAEYQSGLSTFWASWAFLLGSACQLYEVVWRERQGS